MARKPDVNILDPNASIDRKAYEPAYAQLANILRDNMAAGALRPGDQLPSEAQLCERYGVTSVRFVRGTDRRS